MIDTLHDDLQSADRRKFKLLPKGSVPIATTTKHHHSFIWQNKMWICTSCLVRTNCPMSSVVARSKCSGVSCFSKVLADKQGHTIWSACIHGGGNLIYCSRCWSYCQHKPNKLLYPCDGIGGPFANAAMRYFKRNKAS